MLLETKIDPNTLILIISVLFLSCFLLILRLAFIRNRILTLAKQINDLNRNRQKEKIAKLSQGYLGKLERSLQELTEGVAASRSKTQDQISEITRQLAEREAILTSIGEGVVFTDNFGKISMINNKALELLDLKLDEVKGKSVYDTFMIEDSDGKVVPKEKHPITFTLKNGKTFITQASDNLFFVKKNYERFPVSIVTTPVMLNNQITGAIKIFHDITIEKEVDRAKSEFVSLASHQLRTPLTIIKWYLRTLLDTKKTINKELQQSYLNQIYTTTDHMVELVNAILNVSRIDLGTLAVEPELISLKDISESVLFEFGPQIAQKEIKVTKKYDPNAPQIEADPKLIRIVFQNLISNAIKYTSPKGNIDILIELQKNEIVIKVTDNGCGIPKDQKAKIFTKLFRADNAREIEPDGTGLGLYIVKAIAEAASGSVWFESEGKNKGTSFFVTLPLKGMQKKTGVTGLT